jgi:hypothetical protein
VKPGDGEVWLKLLTVCRGAKRSGNGISRSTTQWQTDLSKTALSKIAHCSVPHSKAVRISDERIVVCLS